MAISITLGIILFILICAGFGLAAMFGTKSSDIHWYAGTPEEDKKQLKKQKKSLLTKTYISAAFGLAMLVAFVVIPFSFHEVETGEIAVVKKYGKTIGTKTAGLNFDLWFVNKYEYYDLKAQEITTEIAAYSLDAQTMTSTLTLQYRIQADKVMEINEQYGSLETLNSRITSVAIEKSKVVLSSQSAMQIIENRDILGSQLAEEISKAMTHYNVNVELAVLTNIDFSDAFEKVVEDKMIAEQEKLKAQYEKEKAIIQAEQALEVAKKQAEAEIAKAEGNAQAQIAIAEAQAETIKLKSLEIARMLGFEVVNDEIVMEGHTPEEIKTISDYLKYITYLETWDGKLPETMVGDSSNIIVGLK